MTLHRFNNRSEAALFGAEVVAETARKAIALRGVCRIALSGGSTPEPMLRALANLLPDPGRVHIFQVDERCVPLHSPDSNHAMLRRTLLNRGGWPAENIHRIRGELSPPELAAQRYEREIAAAFDLPSFPAAWDGQDALLLPVFDCVHLGMGDDGHVASLFPGSPHLIERHRWVVSVPAPSDVQPRVERISMTLPLLNGASTLLVLAAGKNKLHRLQSLADHLDLPAARLRAGAGVHWVVSP
jgi:6-phosphogluconolactonase